MKSTGVIRKLDELGRITIPIELRRSLQLDEKDSLEIFVEGDRIILTKHCDCDIFTGSKKDLIEYMGKTISRDTIKELAELAGFSIQE
ncbi:MAG: AbrB/MazE/SpoVT family DNA-binding domain-containing protein [Lachnospiraceae bacterium]|nr:AbrB/MazE/SpoVT family DNA-binding domain-containing protein [Lachnospiraceae bacterium]MDY4971098.1 AbrB/MazE/SpoVT family DNA-binding domain-containing protein [Lachnospiraceae bacterium]